MLARPTVLAIAGWDSSGGAGMSRDLRVLAECGVAAVGAITAVTAQSDAHVLSIQHVRPEIVRDQISAALATGTVRAIKIGMLGPRAIVEAVAGSLPSRAAIPIVLDPVRAASSGRALLDEEGWDAMRELLLPGVTLVTPNIPEAIALTGEDAVAIDDETPVIACARQILALGPAAVLLKGGHAAGSESVDMLVNGSGDVTCLRARRLKATLRGTGCALSSAIAAGLARGLALAEACRLAKDYVSIQLAAVAQLN